MSITMNDTEKANLTRPTHIQGVLIRGDGLVSTFDAAAWLDFCRAVVEQADGLWGRNGGVARVFGCEAGRGLEEHAIAECRRVVSEAGNTVPLHVQIGAVGQRSRWLPVANLDAASRACRRFIETHDLGVSAWRGGQVVEAASKKVVATVSYNGRVWLADGTEVEIGGG
jgi:hypothetical protein